MQQNQPVVPQVVAPTAPILPQQVVQPPHVIQQPLVPQQQAFQQPPPRVRQHSNGPPVQGALPPQPPFHQPVVHQQPVKPVPQATLEPQGIVNAMPQPVLTFVRPPSPSPSNTATQGDDDYDEQDLCQGSEPSSPVRMLPPAPAPAATTAALAPLQVPFGVQCASPQGGQPGYPPQQQPGQYQPQPGYQPQQQPAPGTYGQQQQRKLEGDCGHNHWNNKRVNSKGVALLVCRYCGAEWRQAAPIQNKFMCPDFYSGFCPFGPHCPMMHIHRLKSTVNDPTHSNYYDGGIVKDLGFANVVRSIMNTHQGGKRPTDVFEEVIVAYALKQQQESGNSNGRSEETAHVIPGVEEVPEEAEEGDGDGYRSVGN